MSTKWHRPALANAVGVWLLIYYFSLLPIRYYLKGVAGIFDLLWCCNIAILIAGIGLLAKSATLVCVSAAMCAFPHISWYALVDRCRLIPTNINSRNADAGTWLVAGFFPMGTSSYLAWEVRCCFPSFLLAHLLTQFSAISQRLDLKYSLHCITSGSCL